jgi:gliding motility-associated-like protein
MNRNINHLTRVILLSGFLLLSTYRSSATHIYGADFFYTFVSGTTYNVTLVVYGDCGGSAFPNLSSATPTLQVFNGTNLVTSTTMVLQNPTAGQEVTPVCASQLGNTNCVSATGTIPGVKKFTYTRAVTLGATSSSWLFRFTGAMGSSSAGRSNSITNISVGTPGSVMMMDATLDNTNAPNSSPVYTTIPTPFFCINKSANYNPGTVDANGDSLAYALVPGLDNASGTVTYLTGYSATAPLACSTGTFSFSNTTGQLSFTPNIIQRSLVVNRVSEYRNGVLVGTSMREMTFVVLNNCNNNPPRGSISNVNGGTLVDTITVKACQSSGAGFSFNINPTDPDSDPITMTWSGLPSGASFSVSNNGSTSPSGTFSWNIGTIAAGNYTFFVTYTDSGCPLSSRQTQAYTITVLPNPSMVYNLVAPATCTRRARFTMTPSGAPSPWTLSVLQGSITVHNFPGVTGTQLDSIFPGTYILRVRNANTCFKDTTVVFANPPLIVPAVILTQPLCNGGNNGSITINAGGGKSPFTYAIGTGTYSSVNTFSNLTAGTYTLHIRDSNECQKDTTVQLQQPAPITANIIFTKPPCNFFNSGVITINASGGTSPYRYAIGSGSYSNNNTFSGLSSGTYVLHIRDTNNCAKDSTFNLPDSLVVHATATVTNILCNGATTGAITLTAWGGTAPYRYKLGAGPLSGVNTFTGLAAGTYSFHIEDTNRCYLDTNIIITQPPKLNSPATVTNVLCNGQSNGAVTLNGSGGVSPYTYALGTGTYSSTNSFTGFAIGTYTFHVKDANGCIKDTTITITQPAVLTISNISITTPSCFGSTNGSFTITPAGGTTPYSYAANTGSYGSSSTLGGLGAGTHTLHVRDANGCMRDSVMTMTQPTAIIPAAQVKRPTCSPLNNGVVTLGATGGTPGYLYAVGASGYQVSPVFSSLAAGTYIFHIQDTKSCVKDTTLILTDSLVVTASVNISDVKCYKDSNGTITVTLGGGVSPYTYALGSGSYVGSNIFPGMKAGSYLLHVKDNLGCMKDTNITIAQPTVIISTATVVNPSCFGFTDGSVTLGATGGTPGYTYAVGASSYSTNTLFSSLGMGNYIFHVKDNNGCIRDTNIAVTQPPLLKFTLNIIDVACFGENSGTVTVNATGGTPAYSYAADGNVFQANNLLTNLNVGAHVIHLKDANGCTKDSTITLTEPPLLIIDSVVITHPTCEGFTDGSVLLFGDGGTMPYQYAVDNNGFNTSNLLNGLAEGTYTFRLKDSHNCIADTTITLTGYPHIVINGVVSEAVRCFGNADGKIILDVTGGVQPLSYKLDQRPSVAVSVFEGLVTALYTITITDSKGCKKDTSVMVNTPEKIVIKLNAIPNDCEGYDNNGKISAVVTGGIEPYKYRWSNAAETSEISGMANGRYALALTDAHDCKDSATSDVIYDNCCKVFVPDAFTPNGDGRNDNIRILTKGDFTLKVFSIYNRFGQRVFTTTSMTGKTSDGWNGHFKGTLQDLGTYNYYIKGSCGNGNAQEVEYKGTIELVQ